MWNGEEDIAVKVEKPYSKPYTKLANYNQLPVALNEYSRKIKTLSDERKWITIATLPYVLGQISLVDLDFGDLLIIGFQKENPNCDFRCHKRQATIHKLHNHTITMLGTFDKVSFINKRENNSKNLEGTVYDSS